MKTVIQQSRDFLGMSQAALAKLSRCSDTTISFLERRLRRANDGQKARICMALMEEPSTLFDADGYAKAVSDDAPPVEDLNEEWIRFDEAVTLSERSPSTLENWMFGKSDNSNHGKMRPPLVPYKVRNRLYFLHRPSVMETMTRFPCDGRSRWMTGILAAEAPPVPQQLDLSFGEVLAEMSKHDELKDLGAALSAFVAKMGGAR